MSVHEAPGPAGSGSASQAQGEVDARQGTAREEVLEYLGESAHVTQAEADEIRREWLAETTRGRLNASGFVGSGAGGEDLSKRYKEHLAESLGRKRS